MKIFQTLQLNHKEKVLIKLNQHKNKGTESHLNIFEVAKLMDELYNESNPCNPDINSIQIVLN